MPSSILANLNPEQQEAVTWWISPLLVLAGAGSGKTRVLTHRAAWIISEKGFNPENLLLLTFTNRAAKEMKSRIQNLIAKLPNSQIALPFAGTFHSFCAKILRIYGKEIGVDPGFVIYDTYDQQDAIKEVIKNLGWEKAIRPQSVHAAISSAKNELIDHLEYAQHARSDWEKKTAKVFLEYQKFLKNNNALDFDDLLTLTVKLLKNHKDVLQKLQNRYQYILVDEWQDTNKAQYEIIKLLARQDNNLTVVGDASQSIYSWRGANHRNLVYLSSDFPNLKIINLEQNYRSTQTILDAAYAVINKNTTHPILKLWTENKTGEPIKLFTARTENDEATFIVNEIKKLTTSYKLKAISYKDVAVLYRINALSRRLEEAFLHEGIPYILVGGVNFYERKEIKDVLCYLRLITNPKDSVSRKRAEKLGKSRLKRLENLIGLHISNTLDLLDKVLDTTGYLDLYNPDSKEDLARLENIKELRSVAQEFPDPYEFLEQVALVEGDAARLSAPERSDGGQVTLMTAHAAKGSEFPVVFITGLEEGLFPHSRSLENIEELEEERRLAYVGITRAKQLLYLTLATRRMIFGQTNYSAPSRFLQDIPEHLIENIYPYDLFESQIFAQDIDF